MKKIGEAFSRFLTLRFNRHKPAILAILKHLQIYPPQESLMIRGFAILLGFQYLGEVIATVLDLPLPGSVIGMVLLLFALRLEIIRLDWVRDAAQLLLDNLSMLFIPAGVGVMVYAELIQQQWLPLTLATTISSLVVLAVTGLTDQLLHRRRRS
ncbi:CidA/LrgA family protein [uncultured Desulfuromonas sp.]|uniref:CidA/LrgA family protein n=1 Tax=uncultured Desulfuromonas sp. TaxID=181013 RepID=UPI002AAAD1D9|nr:CidA/LrgA family protein [uncultured Desulfuromonas sp.]